MEQRFKKKIFSFYSFAVIKWFRILFSSVLLIILLQTCERRRRLSLLNSQFSERCVQLRLSNRAGGFCVEPSRPEKVERSRGLKKGKFSVGPVGLNLGSCRILRSEPRSSPMVVEFSFDVYYIWKFQLSCD